MEKHAYDLEERLIQFALRAINVTEALPDTKTANHLGGQLLRSGTSTALNYGEAQSAESNKDFVHKFKVILKELRECRISLRLIDLKGLLTDTLLVKECNELIAIFVASIRTAKRKGFK